MKVAVKSLEEVLQEKESIGMEAGIERKQVEKEVRQGNQVPLKPV